MRGVESVCVCVVCVILFKPCRGGGVASRYRAQCRAHYMIFRPCSGACSIVGRRRTWSVPGARCGVTSRGFKRGGAHGE